MGDTEYAYWTRIGAGIPLSSPFPFSRIEAMAASPNCCLIVANSPGAAILIDVDEVEGVDRLADWTADLVRRVDVPTLFKFGQMVVKAVERQGGESAGFDIVEHPFGRAAEIVARMKQVTDASNDITSVVYLLVPLRRTVWVARARVLGSKVGPAEALERLRQLRFLGPEGARRAAELAWSDLEVKSVLRRLADLPVENEYPATADRRFDVFGESVSVKELDLSLLTPDARGRWEARIRSERAGIGRPAPASPGTVVRGDGSIDDAALLERVVQSLALGEREVQQDPRVIEWLRRNLALGLMRSLEERLGRRGATISSYTVTKDNFELILTVPLQPTPFRVTPDGVYGDRGARLLDADRAKRRPGALLKSGAPPVR